MEDEKQPDKGHNESFHLEILHILKEAQQQHGLRHSDFQRYRQYVARKLRRVRKSLHFPQGTKSRVQPKKVTREMLTDARFLHLKLFEVERSWAYAMQLKAEGNTEPRKRFHMLSRLRKAVTHAEELVELGQADVCDARTKLEMQAYSRWIQGNLHFEMQHWAKAKDHLESAKTIYSGLGQAVDIDQKAIYQSRTEELLPQIRYCAYNMGEQSAAEELRAMRAELGSSGDVDQLDQLLAQTRISQAQAVAEVTWLGHVIPVRHERARVVILAVKEAESELCKVEGTEAKLSLYESVLKSCVDALTAVREEMRAEAVQKGVTGPQSTGGPMPLEKMTRLQLLHTYLQYLKLVKTVERNLLLSQESSRAGSGKPQESARLYDTVMQTLQEIAALPGPVNHEGAQEWLVAYISAYRAFRCYHLAQAYLQAKKFTECTALLKRSQRHVAMGLEAFSQLSEGSDSGGVINSINGLPNSAEMKRALSELTRRAEADELSCRASRLLDMIQDTKHAAGDDTAGMPDMKELVKQPLSERMDVYLEDKSLLGKSANLIPCPPDFEPVPLKPVFFDLAQNHVEFPSLEDKVEDSKKSAKGGLTGLVRGWLWGGGKK